MDDLVCYVKVTGYVKEFLRAEYGDPVRLPNNLVLSNILNSGLVSNVDLNYSNKMCVAKNLWNNKDIHSVYSSLPEKEILCFVRIAIPSAVIRHNKLIKTDGFWQMDIKYARLFRSESTRLFWSSLERYKDNLLFWCGFKNIKQFSNVSILEEFMSVHNISIVWLESLLRQWRRYIGNKAKHGKGYIEEVRSRCKSNIMDRGETPFSVKLNNVKFLE